MTMRKLGLVAVAILTVVMPANAAFADHDYGGDRYRQDEGCGEQGGGCYNEREEDYSHANCKYVCPQFDRSPVQDAFNFNPQICLPGATCHFEDRERNSDRNPPPDEGQPPAH
jgi:hypothetical protein